MDILMVATPQKYRSQKTEHNTLFLSPQEWWDSESLVKQCDDIMWDIFHTHGKYMKIVQRASWFSVAVDKKGNYMGSAFVVELGTIWAIQNVMTDPKQQGKGVASAVLDTIMKQAKKRKIQFVILNCDPKKNNGQLPKLYSRFGFQAV